MEQSTKRRKIAGTSEDALAADLAATAAAAVAVVAGVANGTDLPPCLKLLIDCWEGILDYLSVKDIHSLAGTCKMLNQFVGGLYLKTNIPYLRYQAELDGVYCVHGGDWFLVQPHFHRFIESLEIAADNIGNNDYILDAAELPSLKKLYWYGMLLSQARFENDQSALKKVESMTFWACEIADRMTFHQMGIYCPQLKHLRCVHISVEQVGHLLLEHYPTLEHIELERVEDDDDTTTTMENVNLKLFLEKHSKLNRFTADFDHLWANRDSLMQSNVKLEALKVDFCAARVPSGEIVNFFKALYDRGFYKRLFVSVSLLGDMDVSDAFYALPAMEKLLLKSFDWNLDFSRLSHLNELVCYTAETAWEKVARNLIHLERLYIRNATVDQLIPFARHSRYLKEMIIDRAAPTDFTAFNEARMKFGRHMSIDLREQEYLPAKWNAKNVELNHLKIARCSGNAFEFKEYL